MNDTAHLATTKPPKKRRWLRRVLLYFFLLLLLTIGAAAAIALNPHWMTPVIEKILKKQNISANFMDLNATFQWPTYRLNSRFSARGDGFIIHHAKVDTLFNIKDLWQQKAFIEDSQLSQLRAESTLASWQQRLSQFKPGSDAQDWQRFIPKQWQIDCDECQVIFPEQRLSGSIQAAGTGIKTADVFIQDSDNNDLSARYNAQQQQFTISSKQLNLQPFSGYNAVFHQLDATFYLDNPWRSQASAAVEYAGLSSSLRLQGEGENRLKLQTLTDGNALTLFAEQDDNSVRLRSEAFDLSLFNVLKPVVLPLLGNTLAADTRAQLQALTLGGQLSGSVLLHQDPAHTVNYQIKKADVRLHQVAIDDGQHSINQLSGTLNYRQNDAQANQEHQLDYQLTLANSQLRLADILVGTPAALSGQLHGSFYPHKKRLAIETSDLSGKDFKQLQFNATLDWTSRPKLVLTGVLQDLHLARLKAYLPQHMPPATQSWLREAFIAGDRNHTQFTIAGDLQRFLDDQDFVLQVNSKLNNGHFHYLSHNPDIAIEDAQLNIDRRQLTVAVNKAKIFTNKGKKRYSAPLSGTVNIADMSNAVIDIRATVPTQPLSRLILLANHSLAKEALKTVQSIVTASGDFALSLNILLDMSHKDTQETFDLTLNADNATATLKDYPALTVKKGKTHIVVNDEGLQQLSLTGKLQQQPISIALKRPETAPKKSHKPGEAGGYQVNIDAQNINPLTVLPQLHLLSSAQAKLMQQYGLIKGADNYQVDLRLHDNGELNQVTVNSDWRQTAVNAFSLLRKNSGTPLPCSLTYQAKNRSLQTQLGQRLTLQAGLTAGGDLAGLVLSNQNHTPNYRHGTVALTVKSNTLNIAKLREFYDDFQQTTPTSKPKKNTGKPLNYTLNIQIDEAIINPNSHIPLRLSGDLSDLRIASPLLSGTIHYQAGHLQADIARAEVDNLFNLVKKQRINPEGRQVTTIDLAEALPSMNINANQLIYKGNAIGSGAIHTSITGGRYSIDQILVNGKNFYFDASGYEANEPQGITTHIQADFKGEEIAALIRLFKLNETMDAKFIDASLNISWPGKAHTLNLRQSYGKGWLNAQNVKFSNMSTNVGSVFGLMDITSILRRISLDFKNLTSSKLSFDTVEGHWNIGGGRAMTRDAYATGALIELHLVGAADLYRRVFDDMDLTVIPRASNIFPVIGAVAGGVVGGAAGLLVQQTVGDSINRAVGLPYQIAGKWEAPTVKFMGNSPSGSNTERQNMRHYDSAN